jgi:hypothetical protein
MADPVRAFERAVLELADLRKKVEEKEAECDRLRRELRGGTRSRDEGAGTTQAIQEVVDAVRALGGPNRKPVGKEAVARKLDIKAQAALVRLTRAKKEGLLDRPERGQYCIPDTLNGGGHDSKEVPR